MLPTGPEARWPPAGGRWRAPRRGAQIQPRRADFFFWDADVAPKIAFFIKRYSIFDNCLGIPTGAPIGRRTGGGTTPLPQVYVQD